jgi:hypothetical protein
MVVFAFVDGRTEAVLIPGRRASTRAATASVPLPSWSALGTRYAHVPDPDGGPGEPETGMGEQRLDAILPQRVPVSVGENAARQVHQVVS